MTIPVSHSAVWLRIVVECGVYVDTEFNSTFLVTLTSFATLNEVLDGLVKRFYILPPPNLTADELKTWTEQKQTVVRLRCVTRSPPRYCGF
jgi:hypothetical protein